MSSTKPTKNIIIGCTGSVATIKLPLLIKLLLDSDSPFKFVIKIIITERAKHFFDSKDIPLGIQIFNDDDEWKLWNKRGDPVLHIDLGKWADLLVIAPLDANSLSKMATGLCDNLLMCTTRAWDLNKPLVFCPAMNTRMYEHPITSEQITKLKLWGHFEVPSIDKKLMCGDIGIGAMAEVQTIYQQIVSCLLPPPMATISTSMSFENEPSTSEQEIITNPISILSTDKQQSPNQNIEINTADGEQHQQQLHMDN